MEKPARRSILNLEQKRSTELCRTTSPVMTRKKGRRRSSVKSHSVEEEVVKVNNDVGLNFVKRKESITKDTDELDRKKGSRRRSTGGRRRSSASSTDESIQSDIGSVESVISINENEIQSYESGKQSRTVGQRERSSSDCLTSRPLNSVNHSEDKLNEKNTESENTSKELKGKTGASFEELLNAIDKEFGNKEFFNKTIDRIEENNYESRSNDATESVYCNGKSTREEVINEIDNNSDNCSNQSLINDRVDQTSVYAFSSEDNVTEKQQISDEKCSQQKEASNISKNDLGTSEIALPSETRGNEKESRISSNGINDRKEKGSSHLLSKRFSNKQNNDDPRKFHSTYSKENHITHDNIEKSSPKDFKDSNGYSVTDSKEQVCSTEVHDNDIKSHTTKTNQDNQTERENQREVTNSTKVISRENSITKTGTNEDKPKKVYRQFGMRNRPSKPWQPPPKTTQFEFGISYTK